MLIFYSYVKLPEVTTIITIPTFAVDQSFEDLKVPFTQQEVNDLQEN